MNHSISVIIPTYNRANLIKRTIKSVLDQTLSPKEILICDDGSTDNTLSVIKSFKDKRIKWIPGIHTGHPGITRNMGIKKSSGNWLAFLDSDDVWHPNKLEKQMQLLMNSNCLACCCSAGAYSGKGKYIGKVSDFKDDFISFSDLMRNNYIVCSSAIIHKSLLGKCSGFPEDSNQKASLDYALWLRIATQTNFIYLDEELVNYRDDPENSNRGLYRNYRLNIRNILYDFLRWSFKSRIPIFYRVNATQHFLLAQMDLYKFYLRENIRNYVQSKV